MIFAAWVDSALSGKKAELSFSCTVDNEPKSGPKTPLAPSQIKMTMRAVINGRRLFLAAVTDTVKYLSDW